MSATATRASVGSGYVPPFATGSPSSGSGSSSLSFAKIATGTATSSSHRPTSTSIVSEDGGIDSTSLLEYFTKPYIDAHSLSVPTWRYAYILWFIIAGTLILWSIAYHLSGASNGSRLGALFRKYSIRRIVIQTKKPKKVKKADVEASAGNKVMSRSRVRWASPTYAQMAVLVGLVGVSVCLSFLGTSYINPRTCVFGGTCPYQSAYSVKPPNSLHGRATVTNPGGWVGFTDPLLSASNADIEKNWWTSAARLGLIAYALLPLCVTLALKQWPFNIWATPFLTNYHFDKTAILHRWSGRIIWLFTSGHVAAWLYQSSMDKDPFGRPVLRPLLDFWRFIAGIIGYLLLTLLTLVSFKPIRDRHYEIFYWSHVVMVFLLFATCIVHHRPLMWWPIIAAVWWGAERLCRFLVVLHVNGFTSGIGFRPSSSRHSGSSFAVIGAEKVDGYTDEGKGQRYSTQTFDEARQPLAAKKNQYPSTSSAPHSYPPTLPRSALSSTPAPSYSAPDYSLSGSRTRALPAPGFASAQLLPGRTIRLTVHTPRPIRWQPGQHVFLTLPSIRMFQSHPYTIANCDEQAKGIAPIGGASIIKGSELIILIRAQRGFSKTLWDHVVKKRKEKEALGASADECAKGVRDLRAVVSWPVGSSSRVSWGKHESLLIICGGTGVTFGISVLEYTCRRLARREPNDTKYKTTRVRFVWILREFAHLTWVAPTLRRCIEMVDPSQLQVEIFVSRDGPSIGPRKTSAAFMATDDEDFAPPNAPFARTARSQSPSRSDFGADSDAEDGDIRAQTFDRAFPSQTYGDAVESVTDLILFDGEDDHRTAGEAEVSSKVKKAGKIRRQLSRRGGGRPQPNEGLNENGLSQQQQQPQYRGETRDPFVAGPTCDRSYSELALTGGYGDVGVDQDFGHASHLHSSSNLHSYQHDNSSFADWDLHEERSSLRSGRNGSKATSLHHLVDSSTRANRRVPPDEDGFLDVTIEDQADLDLVAEYAKPGYPKLAEILDHEVNASIGKTMVACCGPNGLNTLVRHLVSSKIDPLKVIKGDPRAQISLVCEDFSF